MTEQGSHLLQRHTLVNQQLGKRVTQRVCRDVAHPGSFGKEFDCPLHSLLLDTLISLADEQTIRVDIRAGSR